MYLIRTLVVDPAATMGQISLIITFACTPDMLIGSFILIDLVILTMFHGTISIDSQLFKILCLGLYGAEIKNELIFLTMFHAFSWLSTATLLQ